MVNATCKICSGQSEKKFATEVLNKHNVDYFKCPSCGFVQTEKPYWLAEAYSSAITSLDLGLISRNLEIAPVVATIIKTLFNKNGSFVDYGGGYGIFVRLLRDKGFNYFRQDIYCENLFAKNFDVTDLESPEKFELLTAFEVMEHLENPLEGLKTMLQYSDNIFFTTTLQPANGNLLDWWYLTPQTGQHIAFHTKESLAFLADQLNLHFSTHGFYHLFSKNAISTQKFEKCFDLAYQQELDKKSPNPPSLLVPDFNKISSIKITN